MADKGSFVMEIADLQHDRRETTFNYGQHVDIPVAYNPGAFTWATAERDEEDQREAMIEALEAARAERFLAVDGGSAYVKDAPGLADYLIKAQVQREGVADQLAAGLVEWPIQEQGQPVPITREALINLPFAFVLAMYQAVMNDMNPAKNSSSGRAQGRRRR